MKTIRCLAVACALAITPLAAQVNISRWTSVKAFPEGYIDRASLNLHFEFPIFNRATVGNAQLNAVLAYDGNFWTLVNGAWQPHAGNGWWLRSAARANLGEVDDVAYGACGWTDGSGSDDGSGTITTHTFNFTEPDGSVATAGSYISVDAPYEQHTEAEYNDCPPSDSLPQSFGIADDKGFTSPSMVRAMAPPGMWPATTSPTASPISMATAWR